MWSPNQYSLKAKIECVQRPATQNSKSHIKQNLGCNKFSTKQKHHSDLGSETSSVWNFWARSLDVRSGGEGGRGGEGEASGGVRICWLFYFFGYQF